MAGVLGRSRFQVLLCRCCSSSSSGGRRSADIFGRHPFSRSSVSSARRMSSGAHTEDASQAAVRQRLEAAAREDRLDFFTAAKILFSAPTKPKKFGLDFHLWQFFVSLLPPFAVYLTAQFARYEMRRMEKEKEEKEQLKFRATLAEESAAVQSLDEESKLSSLSIAQGDSAITAQYEGKEDSRANKGEPVVVPSHVDLLTMKGRLDAMEAKVKFLEALRPGATFIIPLEGEVNVERSEKSPLQGPADQAKGDEEDRQRKIEKQESTGIPPTEENTENSTSHAPDQL